MPPAAAIIGRNSTMPRSERISMIWNTCSTLPALRAATASRTMAASQPVIQRAARMVERLDRSIMIDRNGEVCMVRDAASS